MHDPPSPSPPPIQPMIQADRRIQLSISSAGTWRYLDWLTGALGASRCWLPLRWRADGGNYGRTFILEVDYRWGVSG
jgi:hypothetical protein